MDAGNTYEVCNRMNLLDCYNIPASLTKNYEEPDESFSAHDTILN